MQLRFQPVSKAYPYPEIVTGEAWTVHGTPNNKLGGTTDNQNKVMTVPLNRECENCGINHGREIRRHELGHAKWSPKTIGKLKPGVRPEALHLLEEVRINKLLFEAGLGSTNWSICEELVRARTRQLIEKGSIAELIMYGLAAYTLSDNPDKDSSYYRSVPGREYKVFSDAMQDAMNETQFTTLRRADIKYARSVVFAYVSKLVDGYYTYGNISYRRVQKLAEPLSAILNMFLDRPNEQEIFASESTVGEGESENQDGESVEEGGTGDGDLEKRMRKALAERMTYTSTTEMGFWGDMTIVKPPLPVNLTARLKAGRAYRPADFGYNPKYINRFCIDKKIFKQKQTVLGGTILIDASGSMSFDGKDILDILQLLPAATIAMYNGYGNVGTLRIIAKAGHRVHQDYLDMHSGSGNVVDGPALDWLSTMPPRRIWVSDMHVFGGSGATNGYNLLKYCYDMVTKHRIINLQNIEEVKEHAIKLNMI
tara:strand:+ start:3193 stop:4638 length:1446 start_codon:yes stop_codon:yes gene_type:complete